MAGQASSNEQDLEPEVLDMFNFPQRRRKTKKKKNFFSKVVSLLEVIAVQIANFSTIYIRTVSPALFDVHAAD